jgi:hypothetical protein
VVRKPFLSGYKYNAKWFLAPPKNHLVSQLIEPWTAYKYPETYKWPYNHFHYL